MRLSELGEFGLISRLVGQLEQNRQVVIGPGDDAALVDMPDGDVLVSTDIAVEGVHFRRHWSTPEQIGRRIAAQNLADIAAMGGYPTALVVAAVLPTNLQVEWVEELFLGLAAEAGSAGASVVGGDLAAGPNLTISITVLGQRRGRPAVTRAAATAGQVVAVCGDLGFSAAGLALLERGQREPSEFIDRFRVPKPNYEAGPAAARAGATAMIDISDGLLADAGHIASSSEVGINLFSEALQPSAELVEIGRTLRLEPMAWVLTGGEDHGLLATFPEGRRLPKAFRPIGEVVEGPVGSVTIDGAPPAFGRRGHDHFG